MYAFAFTQIKLLLFFTWHYILANWYILNPFRRLVYRVITGTLAETITTATETELTSYISRFLNKFVIISTHLVCVMWPNYPEAYAVGAALTFKKRNET